MGSAASLPDGSTLTYPKSTDSSEESYSSDVNVALVFIKPHAHNDKCIDYVRTQLSGIDGMAIIGECSIGGEEIKAGKLVDLHYSEIAKNALDAEPSQMEISDAAKNKFQTTFNIAWDEAISKASVYNAQACAQKLGTDGMPLPASALSQRWDQAEDKVKLCPGAYVTKLNDDIFVIDGFYPALREKFIAETAKVRHFVLAFDPKKISWSTFRSDIIGATNPTKAKPNSLRANILANYQSLGLAAPPNNTDNGVHGSAGPLEAIKERSIWLNFTLENDPTASKIISGADDDSTKKRRDFLKSLLDNPLILTPANESKAPAFDLTEDKDTSELISILTDALSPKPEPVPTPAAETKTEDSPPAETPALTEKA